MATSRLKEVARGGCTVNKLLLGHSRTAHVTLDTNPRYMSTSDCFNLDLAPPVIRAVNATQQERDAAPEASISSNRRCNMRASRHYGASPQSPASVAVRTGTDEHIRKQVVGYRWSYLVKRLLSDQSPPAAPRSRRARPRSVSEEISAAAPSRTGAPADLPPSAPPYASRLATAYETHTRNSRRLAAYASGAALPHSGGLVT